VGGGFNLLENAPSGPDRLKQASRITTEAQRHREPQKENRHR
jgi:hypothetical protein